MSFTIIRRVLGLMLLLAALVLLGWGFSAQPVQQRSVRVSPQEMRLPGGGGQPFVPEQRQLIVTWPERLRLGDSGLAHLELDLVDAGSPFEAAPNVFESYTVVAEARLELSGALYRPEGDVSQALLPGKPLPFQWSVRADAPGKYDGTLWLHLRFAPLADGTEQRSVLTAQRISFEVTDFCGLSGALARILGCVGAVLGAVLGLDGVVLWIVRRIHA